MTQVKEVIGYKAFDKNLRCRDFQYEVGQTYEIPQEQLQLCRRGFHFCRFPTDVFEYYDRYMSTFAKITALGTVIDDNNKSVTNRIRIIEIITIDILYQEMPSHISRLNGDQEWYQNGQFHRNDGPALMTTKGTHKWYQNGLLHRDHGPAVIHHQAAIPQCQLWYQHGLLHREDGPALIWDNMGHEYYLNGQLVKVGPHHS